MHRMASGSEEGWFGAQIVAPIRHTAFADETGHKLCRSGKKRNSASGWRMARVVRGHMSFRATYVEAYFPLAETPGSFAAVDS